MIKEMDQPTSSEILSLLSKSHPLTIAEISQQLNLTKADIRYHVSRLIKEGQIKSTSTSNSSSKRGRPAKVFTVSDEVYPDNLKELIQVWFSLTGVNPETLKKAATLLAKNFVHNRESSSFFLKMNKIITELNQRQYDARWEIKPSGPVIYFYNCPYKNIVGQNFELCQMDQFLLSELTGTEIRKQQTIAQNNTNRCMFVLNISV
ncbi:MAG: hypothetical protein CL609_18845 [Anaerolineaceae bacterium]|nr:hypothetical protein [Anaerolineaceae bacterium]